MFTYKKMPLWAIECKRFSNDILKTSANPSLSPSNSKLSEQLIQYFKNIKTPDVQSNYRPRVVWTNGVYWIVFKDASLDDRLSGRLDEVGLYEKFKELKSVDENQWFKKISLLCVDSAKFSSGLSVLAEEIGFLKLFADYVLKCVDANGFC